MRKQTIMRKIQEADVILSEILHEESYEFYIDISGAMEKNGKYLTRYYQLCQSQGIPLKQAQEELGEYLRSNLTVIRDDLIKSET